MRPKFGIKSQQNSQMIAGNSQQDQSWVGIQEFPEKPKKKIMEFFPNSPCWRKSWTTHSHRESWREKRERFQKNSGKRVHSGEKNQGKCQDSIGIFMGKKKELKGWNQGMIGGKKKTWTKSKSIPSGREFWEPNSKGKQHFLFHLQQKSWKSGNSLIPRWILVGKWDFPGFYPTGRNFPGIPIPRKRRGGDARIFLGISGECWGIPEGWN